jgi:hypothetical protein
VKEENSSNDSFILKPFYSKWKNMLIYQVIHNVELWIHIQGILLLNRSITTFCVYVYIVGISLKWRQNFFFRESQSFPSIVCGVCVYVCVFGNLISVSHSCSTSVILDLSIRLTSESMSCEWLSYALYEQKFL